MYNVKKKDGSTQPFDRNRVSAGVMKSGGTTEEAEKTADEVESWLPGAAVNSEITSTEIGMKVVEVLNAMNPTVGASFETYFTSKK